MPRPRAALKNAACVVLSGFARVLGWCALAALVFGPFVGAVLAALSAK